MNGLNVITRFLELKEGKRRGGYNAGLKTKEETRSKESTQPPEVEKGKETVYSEPTEKNGAPPAS